MKKRIQLSLLVALLSLMSFSASAHPGVKEYAKESIAEEYEVKFRIQICAYENHIPYDKVVSMREIGKVMVVKQDGHSFYYSRQYATEADAVTHLSYFIGAGFDDAHEVVEFEKSFISLEDYHRILKEKKDPVEDNSVIRIYK